MITEVAGYDVGSATTMFNYKTVEAVVYDVGVATTMFNYKTLKQLFMT